MAEAKKKTPAQFVTEIESVRMTNFAIRMAWRATAGLLAITVRLVTAIMLAMARRVQRRRGNW